MKGMEILAVKSELEDGEWRELRRGSIGSSDIAGVLGLSNWDTPMSIWYDKVEGKDEEQSIAAKVGLELEPLLASEIPGWIEKHEDATCEVRESPHVLVHPEYPFLTCNLDRIMTHSERGEGIAELKTASEFKRGEWEEDELPDAYYAQVQHQMAVTGYPWAYVAFLIGNRKFDMRFIPRNDDFIEMLIEKARNFWEGFVIPKIPPAPIGKEPDAETLKLLYPGGDEEVLDLSHMSALRDKYKELKKQEKAVGNDIELIRQQFQAKMGDHELALVDGKKVTWKTVTRKEYVVEESTFRRFQIY